MMFCILEREERKTSVAATTDAHAKNLGTKIYHGGQNDYLNNSKIIFNLQSHEYKITGKIKFFQGW